MKNSNRYNDIFSSKEKLSAKDIEQYNSLSPQEKNRIEQKEMNDSFDQDALEGWESISYDTSILKNQKNPFSSTGNSTLLIISITVLVSVLSTYFIIDFNSSDNSENLSSTQQEESVQKEITPIILESSEIILPKEIESLQKQPVAEQKLITEIKSDFHGIEEINARLPVAQPHQLENNHSTAIIHTKTKGKEIYLHDLKLVDYSKYRSSSTIETKQFVLTGTPADLEGENSDNYTSEWKTIQQPYSIFLENSMYYFNNGEYKKALSRFETILKKYPTDVNANFYSGLCFYNFGEFEKAVAHFSKCIQGDFKNFDEEALWLKANSFEKMNRREESKKLYLEISKANGFYAQQAKKKLGE